MKEKRTLTGLITLFLVFTINLIVLSQTGSEKNPDTENKELFGNIHSYYRAKSGSDTLNIIISAGNLCNAYNDLKRDDSAVYYARLVHHYIQNTSYQKRTSINRDNLRKSLYTTGIFLIFNDLIHEYALEIFQILLDLSEKSGDTLSMSNAYYGIGYVYRETNPKEAQKFFRKATGLSYQKNQSKYVVSLTEIGNSFMLQGNIDSAMFYLKKALDYSSGLSGELESMITHDIGHLYSTGWNDFQSAEDYFKKSLDFYLSSQNTRASIIVSSNVADACYHLGNTRKLYPI
ncbi:MAG: hypothetical protein JW731_13125 [Bacteroidales bacterium]|nr:hypothetical protein [Bacteroidales bacterium]